MAYGVNKYGGVYQFTIRGHVVPYVRMTRRGKYVDERAQRYLAWQEQARWQIRSQMAAEGWPMVPERTPFGVRLWIMPRRHNADLDNIAKALIDAAQSVVFDNDCWMDKLEAVRVKDREEHVLMYVKWPE